MVNIGIIEIAFGADILKLLRTYGVGTGRVLLNVTYVLYGNTASTPSAGAVLYDDETTV